jgi:hypothetical protein
VSIDYLKENFGKIFKKLGIKNEIRGFILYF